MSENNSPAATGRGDYLTTRNSRHARTSWHHERFALGRVFSFVYAFDGARLVLAHAGAAS